MTKMTAEQVAAECKRLAWLLDTGGTVGDTSEAYGLRAAADLIREHLIETDEQRRERFESWWRSENKYAAPDAFRRDADLKYAYGNVRSQFEAWQAALTWRGETKGGEA